MAVSKDILRSTETLAHFLVQSLKILIVDPSIFSS